MSQGIQSTIESFIRQGEMLRTQLTNIGKNDTALGSEFSRDIFGEAAQIITRDVLELPWSGKARKYTRALLKQQQKKQRAEAERIIEAQFNSWFQNIMNFLSTTSVIKPNLKSTGNSYELINKLEKAHNYKRLETKIRNTISILRSLSTKTLILNQDISNYLQQMPPKIQKELKEIILPPKKPFTGTRELEDILKNADSYVKIIDPYVDEETLDILTSIPHGLPIYLLTSYIGGKNKERRFMRLCQKLQIERPGFEIRKCDSKLIHDRFVLTKNKGWSIGTSLKDIGKRLSMIRELSPKANIEIDTLFKQIWNKSIELSIKE